MTLSFTSVGSAVSKGVIEVISLIIIVHFAIRTINNIIINIRG